VGVLRGGHGPPARVRPPGRDSPEPSLAFAFRGSPALFGRRPSRGASALHRVRPVPLAREAAGAAAWRVALTRPSPPSPPVWLDGFPRPLYPLALLPPPSLLVSSTAAAACPRSASSPPPLRPACAPPPLFRYPALAVLACCCAFFLVASARGLSAGRSARAALPPRGLYTASRRRWRSRGLAPLRHVCRVDSRWHAARGFSPVTGVCSAQLVSCSRARWVRPFLLLPAVPSTCGCGLCALPALVPAAPPVQQASSQPRLGRP